MEICGKACYDNKQIADKMNRGAAGVEIHLNGTSGKFFSHNWMEYMDTSVIGAIHMPLSDQKDYSIESYGGLRMLSNICRQAALLSIKHHKDIHVIVHLLETKQSLERMGLYRNIVNVTKRLAKQYPSVIICIENTIFYTNTYQCDNVLLAQDIDMPNVGTCLDTCHALITEKLTESAGSIGYNTIMNLNDIFKANAPFCKHMHLCNASHVDGRYGAYKGHGTPFGPRIDDIDPALARILYLYDVNNYEKNDPMVVLEVWEDDYTKSENFSLTKDQILHTLSQQDKK